MQWWELGIFCLIGYLIGAIPFSWLMVRWLKGIDLRTVGSGNLGSTNAMRVLGAKRGLPVQALDIVKGWLPVWLPTVVLELDPIEAVIYDVGYIAQFDVASQYALMTIGLCAVLGHMFPVYLGFRGGKGVNTTIGVFLALAPKAILLVGVVALPLLLVVRIVSLASITGAVLLPCSVWFFYPDNLALTVVSVLVGVLIVFLHRSNIRRLLAGTEPRIGKKTLTEELREREPDRSTG